VSGVVLLRERASACRQPARHREHRGGPPSDFAREVAHRSDRVDGRCSEWRVRRDDRGELWPGDRGARLATERREPATPSRRRPSAPSDAGANRHAASAGADVECAQRPSGQRPRRPRGRRRPDRPARGDRCDAHRIASPAAVSGREQPGWTLIARKTNRTRRRPGRRNPCTSLTLVVLSCEIEGNAKKVVCRCVGSHVAGFGPTELACRGLVRRWLGSSIYVRASVSRRS
jgi:hypothetical protein